VIQAPHKPAVLWSHQVCLCGVFANLLTNLVDLLLVQLIAALVLNTLATAQHNTT
jgi:hypothetical protein